MRGFSPPTEAAATVDAPAVAAAPTPAAADKGNARKNLALSGFGRQLEDLISNHKVRVLVGIFVTHSGEIAQEHVAALRQHFNHIVMHQEALPWSERLSHRRCSGSTENRAIATAYR
jgi:hypothetical protein